MDSAAFLVRYGEFSTAGTDLIDAALTDAATEIDATIYGVKYDAAHGLLTAHKLAVSPYGRSARLVNDDGTTTYEKELTRIRREVAPRFMVI